jgi:hypothetical protein
VYVSINNILFSKGKTPPGISFYFYPDHKEKRQEFLSLTKNFSGITLNPGAELSVLTAWG